MQTAEIFKEGMRLFKAGLINDALLAFEAVAQLEPEHAEAWRMLGQCHADHDEDDKARLPVPTTIDRLWLLLLLLCTELAYYCCPCC
jgi:Flp pilus assembly protein TadD